MNWVYINVLLYFLLRTFFVRGASYVKYGNINRNVGSENCTIVHDEVGFEETSPFECVSDRREKIIGEIHDDISLAFVFDVTTSESMKLGVKELFNNMLCHVGDRIKKFIWMPFHGPDFGHMFATSEERSFEKILENITFKGKNKCEKPSLHPLLVALNTSLPNSFVFLLTNSFSNKNDLLPDIMKQIRTKSIQVFIIMSDYCKAHYSADNLIYNRIVDKSGGELFIFSNRTIDEGFHSIKEVIDPRKSVIILSHLPNGTERHFPLVVDPSVSDTYISATGENVKVSVLNRRGGNPDVLMKMINGKNVKVYMMHSEFGEEYRIRIRADSHYNLRVVAYTNIKFQHSFTTGKPIELESGHWRPDRDFPNLLVVKVPEGVYTNVYRANFLKITGQIMYKRTLRSVNKNSQLYASCRNVTLLYPFVLQVIGKNENGQKISRIFPKIIFPVVTLVPIISLSNRHVFKLNGQGLLTCAIQYLGFVTVTWSRGVELTKRQLTCMHRCRLEFELNNVMEGNRGEYTCTVKYSNGTLSKTTQLWINDEVKVSSKVKIVREIGRLKKIRVKKNDFRASLTSTEENSSKLVTKEDSRPVILLDDVYPVKKGTIGTIPCYVLYGKNFTVQFGKKAKECPYSCFLTIGIKTRYTNKVNCTVRYDDGEMFKTVEIVVLDKPTAITSPRNRYFVPGVTTRLPCHSYVPNIDENVVVKWEPMDNTVDEVDNITGHLVLKNPNKTNQGYYLCMINHKGGLAYDWIVLHPLGEKFIPERDPDSIGKTNVSIKDEDFFTFNKKRDIQLLSNSPNNKGINNELSDNNPTCTSNCTAKGNGMVNFSSEKAFEELIRENGIYKNNSKIMKIGTDSELSPEKSYPLNGKEPTVINIKVNNLTDYQAYWYRAELGASGLVSKNLLSLNSSNKEDEGYYDYYLTANGKSNIYRTYLYVPRAEIYLPESFYFKVKTKNSLNCYVHSPGPILVEWSFNGKSIKKKPCRFSCMSRYRFDKVAIDDEGEYFCTARYKGGETGKKTKLIITDELPKVFMESATPLNLKVLNIINCFISSKSPYNVTWVKVPNGPTTGYLNPNSDNLYFKEPSPEDEGFYDCIVENFGGIFTARTYFGQVNNSNIKASYLTKREKVLNVRTTSDYYASIHDNNVKLNCYVESDDPVVVHWALDGVFVGKVLNCDYSCQLTLNLPQVLGWDGDYECIVKTTKRISSAKTTLHVYDDQPVIKMSPLHEFKPGEPLIIPVQHGPIYNNTIWCERADAGKSQKIPINNLQIRFNNPKNEDEGYYDCINMSPSGITSVRTYIYQGGQIYVKCNEKVIEFSEGDELTLECNSFSKKNLRTYWVITDLMQGYSLEEFPGNKTALLRIRYASRKHKGKYLCLASDDKKIATCSTKLVYKGSPPGIRPKFKVEIFPTSRLYCTERKCVCIYLEHSNKTTNKTAPYILHRPEAVEIPIYGNKSIICPVTGCPKPKVIWSRYDGKKINRDRVTITNKGILTIKNMTEEEKGTYLCQSHNSFGAADTFVDVYLKDEISSSKSSAYHFNPGTIRFRCDLPMYKKFGNVKWYKNGLEISSYTRSHSSTDVFIIHRPSVSDVGSYVCAVETTDGNTCRKYDISLKEIRRPTVVKKELFSVVVLACDKTSDRNANYRWTKNGSIIKKADGLKTLRFAIQRKDEGIISCLVFDRFGIKKKYYNVSVLENINSSSTKPNHGNSEELRCTLTGDNRTKEQMEENDRYKRENIKSDDLLDGLKENRIDFTNNKKMKNNENNLTLLDIEKIKFINPEEQKENDTDNLSSPIEIEAQPRTYTCSLVETKNDNFTAKFQVTYKESMDLDTDEIPSEEVTEVYCKAMNPVNSLQNENLKSENGQISYLCRTGIKSKQYALLFIAVT